MARTLLLLRHGESESNAGRIYAGSGIDMPLTGTGIRQAECQARALAGIGLDEIHSSPLRRARQTAERVSHHIGIAPVFHPALQEVDVGILEGTDQDETETKAKHDEIVQQWEQGRPDVRFPEGESLEEVEGRLRGFIDLLDRREPAPRSLVVGHCMLFMAAIWLLCENRGPTFEHGHMGRGHLSVLGSAGGRFRLMAFNLSPEQSGEKLAELRWG